MVRNLQPSELLPLMEQVANRDRVRDAHLNPLTDEFKEAFQQAGGKITSEEAKRPTIMTPEREAQCCKIAAAMLMYSFKDIPEGWDGLTPAERDIVGSRENFHLLMFWVGRNS